MMGVGSRPSYFPILYDAIGECKQIHLTGLEINEKIHLKFVTSPDILVPKGKNRNVKSCIMIGDDQGETSNLFTLFRMLSF